MTSVSGRAEVQAVGDGERAGPTRGDVAERLGERELGSRVGVELGEATVAVGGHRDAEVGVGVHADHAAVGGLGQDGVALDVAVVLVGDPGAVAQVGARDQREQGVAELGSGRRPGEAFRAVRLQGVLPVGTGERSVIGGAVVGDRARGTSHDALAVPVDVQTTGVGDLPDHHRLDVPLRADRHEGVDVGRLDDRHHPLLRLAHEDLLGASVQSRSGTRSSSTCMPPSPADASSDVAHERPAPPRSWMPATRCGGEDLERALDEQLLHEGVPDLDARTLGGTIRVEGLGCQHGDTADAVAAGAGAVEDDPVARTRGLGEVRWRSTPTQSALTSGLPTEVSSKTASPPMLGSPSRTAVAADAGHDPRQHTVGVGGIERPNAAGPSLQPGARPSRGCRGRCPRRRSPHPGRARRRTGGCGGPGP